MLYRLIGAVDVTMKDRLELQDHHMHHAWATNSLEATILRIDHDDRDSPQIRAIADHDVIIEFPHILMDPHSSELLPVILDHSQQDNDVLAIAPFPLGVACGPLM